MKKKRLNFASSHNDKDVSNWVFGERPKNFIFLFGTLGQLSQLEIFGSKKSNFGQIYPSWPNHLCLFNHPSTQWLEKSKNWVLFWCGLGILLGVQKKPKTRFFNFQVQFWEPSHQLRWIHDTSKKNFKPSSLRKYPQTAQYTHPRPSNTPPKRTQMLLDSL